MTKTDTIKRCRDRARVKHLSYRTEQAYVGWIKQYIDYITTNKNLPDDASKKVEAYLTHLATRPNPVAASTQNQALAALLFLYSDVFGQPLENIDALRAKQPVRLPPTITHAQAMATIRQLAPEYRLIGLLLYGSGLRLMECLRLRVKDIDTDKLQVTVRGGKGDKDRATILAQNAVLPLQNQIHIVSAQFAADQTNGCANVFMPDALDVKYPNAKNELGWQWLFPASNISHDPRSGQSRRHHLHPSTVGRAIKEAGQAAGVAITPHVFRHTFATNLLNSKQVDIYELSKLLGHRDISTTEVYAQLVAANGHTITSPADEE